MGVCSESMLLGAWVVGGVQVERKKVGMGSEVAGKRRGVGKEPDPQNIQTTAPEIVQKISKKSSPLRTH